MSRDQKVALLGMWCFLKVIYHSTKFDDDRYCGTADISSFHLSRHHVFNRSCDFEGGVPPRKLHFANFGGHRYCGQI